jgi:tetratricopeptide (TPR) repeat protein
MRARDSVCEQCHLEGAARILNPGKTFTDFKPGLDLEATLSIYVVKQQQGGKAVSQEEQLALSRCARESGGKLWCGSCHNPHSQAKDRAGELKAVCTSCHPVASLVKHSNTAECQSCHMPSRTPTDVAHTALTDHRILAAPAASVSASSTAEGLRAWRDPRPELQERNLGLAYLAASADSAGGPFGEMGENLLKKLPASQRDDDPAALAALGDISLAQGHAADAAPFFRRASELDSSSGEYALYLGIALKQNGDLPGASEQWKRAIQLDPSLQRAYLELSALYAKQKRFAEAKATLDEYLKWNSQSILVRLTREALPDSKE